MLAITLNPGFVLILAALLMLAAPTSARPPIMAGAAAGAMWLLLGREFGAAEAMRQMRLEVVLLKLDALNQVFGIAFIAALMLIALYSSSRRNRYEDAAILLLAGGAVSALFVGDVLSFIAFAAVAGLAAAWVVLAAEASRAGVRLLVWHGLEGLLFLAGVAFLLSAGAARTEFTRLEIDTIGGGFIFAALMIRVGAPLAHVWLKDATSHASGPGAVALTVFTTMFGVYALARMYPAEGLLIPIGAAMIVIGAIYASAEDDLRRAGACALMAQTGVCVALIGVGSPLALASAAAHAFTTIFAFALIQMALGAAVMRRGSAAASGLEGLSQTMPVTAALLLIGGLAASGTPGFSPYVSAAVTYEAVAQWPLRLVWALFMALAAASLVAMAVRPALAAYTRTGRKPPMSEATFPMLLAMALAAFFLIAVGLSPPWLYRLLPATDLTFDPYTADRLGPQLALIGAAGVIYVLVRALKLAPRERALTLMDVDALYRGPIAGAGQWIGLVLLRLFGAVQVASERLAERAGTIASAWARSCDRPYADRWAGAAQLVAICGLLVLILAARG